MADPVTIDRRDEAPTTSERSVADRWGRVMARHRKPVLVVWLLIVIACAAAYPALNARLQSPEFTVNGSESERVDQAMAAHFPQLGVEQAVVVFDSADRTVADPEFRRVIAETERDIRGTDGIRLVLGPLAIGSTNQISADRKAAFAVLGMDGDTARRARTAEQVQALLAEQSRDGIRVALTGYSAVQNDLNRVERVDVERAEAIGVPVALVILVLAFGAVVAAAVPVGVAMAGVLLCFGAMFVLSTAGLPFDSLVLSVATMIGTGVGIDYAMFVVSRFREELAHTDVRGRDQRAAIEAAVGVAVDRAGKTVLASGLIVMISLCSLVVMQSPIFRGIAIAVGTAIVCTLLVAMTLLPALLATLGPAINRGALPKRLRPAEIRDDAAAANSGWARWAHAVMARPVLFGAVAVLLLLIAAAPLAGIRYGLDMGSPALAERPSGHASKIISDKFTPGLLAPVEMIALGPGDTPLNPERMAMAERFADKTSADPRVQSVIRATGDRRLMISAIPAVAFDSTEAGELVRNLRADADELARTGGPVIIVGGISAEFVDISDEITGKAALVVGLVLASSFVFLAITFRSLLLPAKAIVMNLLATAAALGITVTVFQWGFGQGVLDFRSPGFLQVFLPTLVFVILFGLSMDYEVFLIRRMKESWDADADNANAVATGLAHTARPITAAAAIMVVVFGSFVTADVLELKEIGMALAVAVAIDAVIVRLILVPALMRMFGRWNWWLPGVRSS